MVPCRYFLMPSSNSIPAQPKKQLSNKQANEFAFKSKLRGPISELSFLRKSLLFAEISMISYLSVDECNIAAGKLGFTDGKFFDCGGSQAYWFQNEHDSVIVIRGTEARDWNDIKADANALTALAETVGKVHRGFKTEVDEIWPHIEKELEKNEKTLWFCGHSLGGAMATICAGRCMISYIKSEPEALFTFGSPRVGCKRFVNHIKMDHFRWVNNNDIVTRVPPVWLGYRHSGNEIYLDRLGRMKQISGWSRLTDRLRGFLSGLRKFRLDQLSDHSSLDYIDNIFRILRVEEAKLGTRQSAPKSPISNPAAEAIHTDDVPVAGSESAVDESKKQLSA